MRINQIIERIMHQLPDNIDDNDIEYVSKSEMKREMLKFQEFAQEIINLSKHQRSKLPLTPELLDAMVVADKIKNKHEALRRHVRYVGKLLSTMDLTPIHQALDLLRNKHQQETLKFHQLEQQRDYLLAASNQQIEDFLIEHPQFERQKLKQLIRNANKEKKAEKPAKSYRELFQYLKSEMN